MFFNTLSGQGPPSFIAFSFSLQNISQKPVPQDLQALKTLKTIRKYNEDLRNASNSGPDAVPPVPLKIKIGKGSRVVCSVCGEMCKKHIKEYVFV